MDYLSREAVMFYGVLATLAVALWNLKNSKGDRYIDSINAERVKWINTVRDLFSEFDKTAYLMGQNILMGKSSENEILKKELIFLSNQMELFLNPTEVISKAVIDKKNSVVLALMAFNPTIDGREQGLFLFDLRYLQQVILKSEWKRVKKETQKGKEVSKQEIRDIYIEIATAIDIESYNVLLKVPFEEESSQED
ncbi:hypothetical protein [Niallia taxi]|uniref:Uncharacterized protein n=1 Tax=Niallia taxi TaxID=2499688 RepID=A0A437K2U8_9BACI|nr:hypothetical protein [Niallia taxi]RVT56436.1 hypothetical protein EM808_27495 [Niallia taxi]